MSETSRVLLETANRLLAENNKLLLQRFAELEAELAEATNDAARWRNAHDEIMKYAAGVEEKAQESIAECASELAALREDRARLVDAILSIRLWRPPDGSFFQVKDLQWFKALDAARKEPSNAKG